MWLSIQSDQTFLFMKAPIQASSVYTGSVATVGNEVQLITSDPDFFMPRSLIPVEWGQRKYLIPAEEITDFCYEVKQGWEPRTFSAGSFYLREEDWDKPARGVPVSRQGDRLCP
jgi:hypothetical protein